MHIEKIIMYGDSRATIIINTKKGDAVKEIEKAIQLYNKYERMELNLQKTLRHFAQP